MDQLVTQLESLTLGYQGGDCCFVTLSCYIQRWGESTETNWCAMRSKCHWVFEHTY